MRKLVILLIFCACTSSQNEELNQQSIELHEAAMQLGKQAKEKIGQLETEVQALADSVMLDSVTSMKQDYEDWESSIVEVPGHEHDHHDHAGHDHDHGPSPDLTPEMVLEIQTELKLKAEKLNDRAEKLLDMIKSEDK